MQTAKQEVETMLQHLSEDSTYEDIQYHLYVLEKIRRGVLRSEDEGTLTQQEVETKLRKWLIK